jgi:hypothetical protein
MAMQQVAGGLRRWTAWHAEWKAEVGSLALETGDGLVLIDPPPELLGGPLRICPDSWIGKPGRAGVRAALSPLLDLPIELVLVSRGEPVLARGRAALASALAQAPSAA